MIPIKKLSDLSDNELHRLFNRMAEGFSAAMFKTVIPIVDDVRKNGDRAVIKYTKKFDGVRLDSLTASPEEIESGRRNVPDDLYGAFLEAKRNIEEFHRLQMRGNILHKREDGTLLGVLHQPIENAAVYVPGGTASYPSSVLMGTIPAQIAGVENITLVTPPAKNGLLPDVVCAVCAMLGVSAVIKSGGAQGIAAAGFGTGSIAKADIIVGPGNIYVSAAKAYLYSLGAVQIDGIAGPSEVLVIADVRANPKWVAWDLLSQAEHDEMSTAILVTTSKDLALAVADEIARDIDSGSGRHDIKKASIEKNGLILIADSIGEAIDFSNRYGPEHMEFMVHNPMDYLPRIKNVGSLFLGDYAPVAVGDYYSGTNHILPTGGAARFSSGTSVDTFMRRTTYQMLSAEALSKARDAVNAMSRAEGFQDKHGGSVNVRFEE
ncbi:MAG: histidinol dehydrogenase [Spirochaetes bacterium RBG_16_49_21]|nr:MAG: histidinol dehydrogenase [Spirochaetes bacterium RBG_16_49_21]